MIFLAIIVSFILGFYFGLEFYAWSRISVSRKRLQELKNNEETDD